MKSVGAIACGTNSRKPLGYERIYRDRDLGAIAARWDSRASEWDHALESPECHLNEDDAYNRFIEQARAAISRRRTFCKGQGVVDVGCGTGLVLAQVVAAFKWGIGVDISPKMIRAARRKKIRKARFVVGDCFRLARLGPPAGAILSRGVLLSHYGREHAEAWLASALSSLVEGGFLMCDFLNLLARESSGHKARGKTFYGSWEVRQLARRVGFKKSRVLGKETERVLFLLLQR